jgi:hypothetical protein
VFLLIRLNRQYRREASVVEAISKKPPDPPNFARRTVLILVDDDLADRAIARACTPPRCGRCTVTDQPRADHLPQCGCAPTAASR